MGKTSECGPCKVNVYVRLLLLNVTIILYLVLGAFVFSVLEKQHVNQEVDKLRELKHEFRANINICNVTDSDVENFLKEVVKATQSGILITDNVTFKSSWSFGQSLLFVVTLLTTIGYGHTLPLSDPGKIFAVFYCVVGLPLMLIFVTAWVAWIVKPIRYFLAYLKIHYGFGRSEFKIRVTHLSMFMLIQLVAFFLIPSAVFCYLESDWNYFDSLYYCFISLTTIGLGDYIPGEKTNQPYRTLYKILVAVYLLLGIMGMMIVIKLFYRIEEFNLSRHFVPLYGKQAALVDPESECLTDSFHSSIENYSAGNSSGGMKEQKTSHVSTEEEISEERNPP